MLFCKESCIRVHGIEFADEVVTPGTWVVKHDKITEVTHFIPIDEYYAGRVHVHGVITDELPEPLINHVDGKLYTSKAKMREVYRQHGYVEVGTNTEGFRKKAWKAPSHRETFKESIQMLQSSTWREELAAKRARGILPPRMPIKQS